MATLSYLQVTNGTESINLNSTFGFHLLEWRPQVPSLKDDGVWNDSPLADGRRLAMYRRQNAVETFQLAARQNSQDLLIHQLQDLQRLLNQALDYWQSSWPLTPVYVVARGPWETNFRYAIVHSYAVPELNNPYGQPFTGLLGLPAFQEFNLILEIGPWQSLPPGQDVCTEIHGLGGFDGVGMCAASGTINTGYLLQENFDNILLENGVDALLLDDAIALTGPGVYVGNKYNTADLTHVYRYVAATGIYGPNLVGAALPYALLPNPAVVDDAVYFGSTEGPFNSIVLNLATAAVEVAGLNSGSWSYRRSAGVWGVFDPTNITDNSDRFTQDGSSSVHWDQPFDWGMTVINGVNAYWVRFVVSGAGNTTAPEQDDEQVYTVTWPCIEIDAEDVLGDIPLLARIQVFNRSADGDTELGFDRLTIGLRSISRGDDFRAYWNFSEEQNPLGITVTSGAGGVFSIKPEAPALEALRFSSISAGTEVYGTFQIGGGVYPQYRGTYNTFLRLRQYGGTAGTIRARIRMGALSGTVFSTLWESDWSLPTTQVDSDYTQRGTELIDLGRVSIPPSPMSDLYTSLQIRIVLKNAVGAAAASVDLYDFILIPIDEWSGTFLETADDLEIRRGYCLEIDSTTDPKRFLKAADLASTTMAVFAPYHPISNGPMILQANADQRLWFLAALDQLSSPSICSNVMLYTVDRYLAMRGAR